jgi:hypothetical protein
MPKKKELMLLLHILLTVLKRVAFLKAQIKTTWYRNYFYLCEKFKSESPNRMVDEFETKFVRLEYKGKDSFDFSYFRHTGAWHLVAQSLSLEDCKELILSNPNFQPIPF